MKAMLISLLGYATLHAAPPVGQTPTPHRQYDFDTIIDGNNVACFIGNTGNVAYDHEDLRGKSDGFYFPDNWPASDKTVIYDAGLWLAGVTNTGDTLVAVAEYSSEYQPGAYGSNHVAPEWRVYDITADPASWADWPVEQGAPLAANGQDPLIADLPGAAQMLWAVFNEGNPASHTNDAGSTAPLGIEARLTAWCYPETSLESTVFLRWELLNQGNNDFSQFYIGFWLDPDLGGASDDLAGIDLEQQLGMTYNATNDDTAYGTTPPAVGAVLLYGPHVPAAGDSAFYQQAWHANEANLALGSFSVYYNGIDPNRYDKTFFYAQGLTETGQPRPNGPFDFPGDPVEGTGVLDFNPADRRMLLACAPVTFAPGARQELAYAVTAARGADRLASITLLRELAPRPYPEGWENEVSDPSLQRTPTFRLASVHPNPFNPSAQVELELARPVNSARLQLFNLQGQRVWSSELGPLPAGAFRATLRPDGAASGLYLLRAEAGGTAQTSKVLLLR